MERWSGRVALVTGASSGVGAAIAKELVKNGVNVVGVARRVERIKLAANGLRGAPGTLHPLKCDITKEEEILSVFEWIKKNVEGVDVLVNCAGTPDHQTLSNGDTELWKQTIESYVIGLSICTKEAIKSMKERSIDDGHIIHINSVAGHQFINIPNTTIYTAAKQAVTALTEGLRRELVTEKSHIRVTSISPGLVRTEGLLFYTERQGDSFLKDNPQLSPKDVADAVVYVLGTAPHVQIHELTLRPVGEDF